MNLINEVIEKKHQGYPERILQFGEGNFLRAFADWMIDMANSEGVYRGNIVISQAIPTGMAERFQEQNSLYTVAMRGLEDGRPTERFSVISSVSRCINPYQDYDRLLDLAGSPELEVIISNTTEAGIAYREGDTPDMRPPESFPAKLCVFLYERYRRSAEEPLKPLLILPVELIDNNGAELKKIVLRYAAEWKLEDGFFPWLEQNAFFTNTLVDRIVTGYPKNNTAYFEEKLGYSDPLLVTCELFNLWVIEGKKEWADILPIHKTSAHVVWTDDVSPYKKRKVRILNGSHTAAVPGAYLAGMNNVLDMMNDPDFRPFEEQMIYGEILPSLDMPEEEINAFAGEVIQRFCNPYLDHRLLDITLNSCSKFRARCLPSIFEYVQKQGELPAKLVFSLAAFIRFYQISEKDGAYFGTRENGERYAVLDDAQVLAFFAQAWKSGGPEEVVAQTLGNRSLWDGEDLRTLKGLEEQAAGWLKRIETDGVRSCVRELAQAAEGAGEK